jgi:hypothetical protein
MHIATLNYTERLVSEAVRSYWLRSMGWGMAVVVAVITAGLVSSLARGDRSWLVGLLAAGTALGFGLPVVAYVVHYRNSMAKFREMKNPMATLLAEDTSFTLTSDVGASTLKWNAVAELWRFKSFWLLLFSKSHFATIPLAGMSAEMQSYVLERIRRAGGKVAV